LSICSSTCDEENEKTVLVAATAAAAAADVDHGLSPLGKLLIN